jgi:hypothetical protein
MPVLKLLEPLSFSPPFLRLFVKFRPYFVRFISSDFYGAGPFATAHHCLQVLVIVCIMEEETMEEEKNEAPGAPTFTIYIPDFSGNHPCTKKTKELLNLLTFLRQFTGSYYSSRT